MSLAGNLSPLIQIEKDVHDGVVFRDFHNGPIRKHPAHGGFEDGPVIRSMQIIHQQESATQQVLAKIRCFYVVGSPVPAARLLQEQEWIFKNAWIAQFKVAAVLSDRHIRRPLKRRKE